MAIWEAGEIRNIIRRTNGCVFWKRDLQAELSHFNVLFSWRCRIGTKKERFALRDRKTFGNAEQSTNCWQTIVTSWGTKYGLLLPFCVLVRVFACSRVFFRAFACFCASSRVFADQPLIYQSCFFSRNNGATWVLCNSIPKKSEICTKSFCSMKVVPSGCWVWK